MRRVGNGMGACPLLLASDIITVRKQLVRDHQHFYHFTLDCHLPSLKTHGIHPQFESDDSTYGLRDREPLKAMRYFTKSSHGLSVGLTAASTRASVWVRSDEMWVDNAQVILLRAEVNSLLDRSFGPDLSFGDVACETELMLGSRQHLCADEFIQLITKFGVISCYDAIPPDELEICNDAASFSKLLTGQFVPLVTNGT